MTDSVAYEWCLETTDEFGDIVENDSAGIGEPLSALLTPQGALGPGELVLVCSLGNDQDGLLDRGWAYVEGGKLPAWATGASDGESPGHRVRQVPQRFHRELERVLAMCEKRLRK